MEWDERRAALQATFTPAKPVTNQELFAGRTDQLMRVVDTFNSPGEHAAIFGERGVGKTSLASIAEAAASLSGRFPLRFNCQANDDASDIWKRAGVIAVKRVRVDKGLGRDVPEKLEDAVAAASSALSGVPSSQDLMVALEILAVVRPVVIFLDEFDRLGDTSVHTDLVDLMKSVADMDVEATFVVVGVASTVDGLIDEHASIGRGLNQIEMPRMSPDELVDVLDRGLAQAEMVPDANAAQFIAKLSMGLPHYTHLMGLHGGLAAVSVQSERLTIEHVALSLPTALDRAQQHVRELYLEATHSTQQNIFREVLLAAALTQGDERGFFAPGDLREPLSLILGRRMEIPSFARHLKQFADSRGPVLEKSTRTSRPRYRFSEPLLVPFIAMRGVSDGLIHRQELQRLM